MCACSLKKLTRFTLQVNLSLNKTSETSDCVSYLDIFISIRGKRYVTKVYDKRDNFNSTFCIHVCVSEAAEAVQQIQQPPDQCLD